MVKRFARIFPYVVVGGLFVLAASPVAADGIVSSDTLTVYNPDKSVHAQVTAIEQENPLAITIINDPTLADPNKFPSPTSLIEPLSDPMNPAFSDIFGVVRDVNGNNFLGFSSDDEVTTLQGNSGVIRTPELDTPFDATMYLTPALQTLGYTATFQSVDAPVTPEPTSLALMGIAGLSLTVYTRIRRRRR